MRFKAAGELALSLLIASGSCDVCLALDTNKRLTQYQMEAWGIAEGLPQSSAQALLRSKSGHLWVGTQEGLARFDGREFKVFDTRNTASMTGHDITALYEDPVGTLWVGTYAAGVNRFHDGTWSSLPMAHELDDVSIVAIVGDAAGSVWIATDSAGLLHWSEAGTRRMDASNGLASDFLLSMTLDRRGDLWIGTDGAGLSRYSGGTVSTLTIADGLPDDVVTALFEDSRGTLWIGTRGGLGRWRDGVVERVPGIEPFDTVWAIAEDTDSVIWAGTEESGLVRVAPRPGGFDEGDGLPSRSAISLLADDEGSLWVGLQYGGVARFEDTRFAPFGAEEGLSTSRTLVVHEDPSGDLWTGTWLGGLNRIRGGLVEAWTVDDGLCQDTVLALNTDSAGTLWVGTDGGGLGRRRDESFECIGVEDGLASPYVWAIEEDLEGALWVGTSLGLSRIHSGGIDTFTVADGLASDQILALHETRDGSLWVGTEEGPARRRPDGRFEIPSNADPVRGTPVLDIHEDSDGWLWFATSGSGVLGLRDGKSIHLTVQQGLYDDLVFRILEDQSGRLWFSCNRGVFVVERQELDRIARGEITSVNPTVFGVDDGMRSRECNGGSQPAGWRAADGRLWFPTLDGLVSVDPESAMAPRGAPPSVRIDEVLINGETAGDGPYELPRVGGEIAVRFGSATLVESRRIRFRARLEGPSGVSTHVVDDPWTRFSGLSAGRYRLSIAAARPIGPWSETEPSVDFLVVASLYQRPFFWIPVALSLALFLYGAQRFRLRRLLQQRRSLQDVVRERTSTLARQSKKLEDLNVELRRTAESAGRANRAKSAFLANMSHELRTPMMAILGSVAMLENLMPDDRDAIATLQRLHRASDHLLGLVNGVLDLSKIEAGEMKVELKECDLASLLTDVSSLMQPLADEKGLTFDLRLRGRFPRKPRTDCVRLRQIVINLISNGIKFSDNGGILIEVSSRQNARGRTQLGVAVTDTGPGIKAEELVHLFEPFFQSDDSKSRKSEGTGLGLAIVKRFAELLDGEIEVFSTPGQGATFVAWVDAGSGDDLDWGDQMTLDGPAPDKYVEGAPTLAGRRVHIVDDNPDNRAIIRFFLEQSQIEVSESPDGQHALETLAATDGSDAPLDLVLMDMMMPGLDGYAVTRKLRASGFRRPIVALTALSLAEDRELCLASGCNEYLPKPVCMEELLRVVARHTGSGKSVHPSGPRQPFDRGR